MLIVEVNAKNTVPKIINAYTVYIQTKRRITGAEATGVVRLLYCLAQKPNTVCILLATAIPPRQARFLCGDSDYYMKNIYCMAKEKCLRVQYPIFVLFEQSPLLALYDSKDTTYIMRFFTILFCKYAYFVMYGTENEMDELRSHLKRKKTTTVRAIFFIKIR